MLRQESLQRRRANLLFTLKDKLDVAVHQPFTHEVFKGLDLNHGLPLIVIRSACIETAVTYRRFPRVGVPSIKRFDRHYVVMGVDQNGRRFGI